MLATVHSPRTVQSGEQALEHRVVELTVTDAGVTMVRRVIPAHHPFHCWSLVKGEDPDAQSLLVSFGRRTLLRRELASLPPPVSLLDDVSYVLNLQL